MTNFMGIPEYFKSIYVWSGVWQGMGYSSIIYIAALAGVDPSLYEAARMDGASRLQKNMAYRHSKSSFLSPSFMLILNLGSIMGVGFEKIYLMQNPLNTSASEVISTYVYKVGSDWGEFQLLLGGRIVQLNHQPDFACFVNAHFPQSSENSLW